VAIKQRIERIERREKEEENVFVFFSPLSPFFLPIFKEL
jgi:hypothetical protein